MTDWKLKTKAFLYNPPDDRALDVAGARARASELLQIALGDGSTQEVEQADRWACGLDVPPFVQALEMPEKLLLKHPLSGEEKEVADFSSIDKGAIAQGVREAVQEIHAAYSKDEQKLFLALWRLLPKVIRERDQDSPLRDYWELMPYDPRVPDHSIWDHQALTSALATTADANGMPKPALLIFGLGSVQEFLSTARRTQDLWMGSFLLSYLVWEAIKPLANEYGPDCVIYPNLRGQPLVDRWLREDIGLTNGDVQVCKPESDALRIANFPNIFTAVVPQEKAEEIANKCMQTLNKQWCKIAECVQNVIQTVYAQERAFDLPQDDSWKQAWKRQIPDLIDRLGIFWVAYPWGEDPKAILTGDYSRLIGGAKDSKSIYTLLNCWLKAIEAKDHNGGMAYPLISALAVRFYSSRKNLRDFQQTEEPNEKCSQCGVREALHPTETKYHAKIKDGGCKVDPDALKGEELDKVRPQQLLRIFWKDLAKIGEDEKVSITINGQEYKVKLAGRIRRGDRLCAVCLSKRLAWEYFFIQHLLEGNLGEEHLTFPSTSTIAAASFKLQILRKVPSDRNLYAVLEAYINEIVPLLKQIDRFYPSPLIPRLTDERAITLQANNSLNGQILADFLHLDGEWFYPESLTVKAIAYEYELVESAIPEGRVTQACEKLKALLSAANKAAIPKLRRYYALLYFDGDKVSKWVSGEKAPNFQDILHLGAEQVLHSQKDIKSLLEKKRPLGPASHATLSAAMKHFALDVVRPVIEEHHCGKLIYAGGDDVLAFMPVDELLPIMQELRQLFSGTGKLNGLEGQNGYIKRPDGTWIMSMGEKATASAAVVIAHHTHPFSQVVEEAAKALKKHAKNKAKVDRNGFAIHLYKRSGAPREIGAKWSYEELDTLDVLQKLTKLIQNDRFSSKLAYQMADEALGLAGFEGVTGREAKTAELKGLTGRHMRVKPEELSPEERACLFEQLPSLINEFDGEAHHPKREVPWKGEPDWIRVADLVLLARFLVEEA